MNREIRFDLVEVYRDGTERVVRRESWERIQYGEFASLVPVITEILDNE